jgi:acetyl-CoA synthetase
MKRRVLDPDRNETFDQICANLRWSVPERFNLGAACTDDLPPGDPAIITVRLDGSVETMTFGELAAATNRFANVVTGLGGARGDRIGIVLPQSAETMIAHLGTHKAGAVALPLAGLFGPDALRYRLADSGAKVVVTCPEYLDKVAEAVEPGVAVMVTGSGMVAAPHRSLGAAMASASDRFEVVDTAAEDPATLIYTSGTTGPAKGALHAHRFLFGHLPSYELYYDFFPQAHDVAWTPADWAWIGALMDAVVPTLYYGRPVVTTEQHRFDPEFAADLMAAQRVTAAFIPPTGLKMMRAAGISRSDLSLRAVFTGGEALGEATLTWGREHLGAAINEGYGQTEANLTVGNSSRLFPVRPGSMGKAMPGHTVRVLDENGRPVVGQEGEIAVLGPDPVMMLGYWQRPDATEAKFLGDWMLMGDLGVEDEDGYLWFSSRKDDVIISSGFRIGPGEIEESLIAHPAVALSAAIGVPDDIRGEVVKAFVVLSDGYTPSRELTAELQHHVRTRLAAHEVPKEIEYLADLPRTATGKIMRRELRDAARYGSANRQTEESS